MASIQKRETADGQTRYTMRVFIGRDPNTGRRKFVCKTFDRRKDAQAEARRLEGMKDRGELVRRPSKEPFARYLTRWLEDKKRPTIRARTYDDYSSIVRRYIGDPPAELPPVGMIPLRRLTPDAFNRLYSTMWTELGLAPRTIQYLHSIVRQALKDAVSAGDLPRNPTDGVRPPSKPQEEATRPDLLPGRAQRAMGAQQVEAFLAAASADRYAALWMLLLAGGLRPGEALALTWDDVDFTESRVHVSKALTRRGVEGWKIVPPKRDNSRRSVALPATAIRALRDWRRAQAEERLQLGAEYQDNGFVFANEFGKPLHLSNLYARNFRRIMKQAGLGEWRGEGRRRRFQPGFRIYDLRHTCATLLLRQGVNPKIVQERLGHANIAITLDTYSHVLPDMQEVAADALEAMLAV